MTSDPNVLDSEEFAAMKTFLFQVDEPEHGTAAALRHHNRIGVGAAGAKANADTVGPR
jgi:hypothetical protein